MCVLLENGKCWVGKREGEMVPRNVVAEGLATPTLQMEEEACVCVGEGCVRICDIDFLVCNVAFRERKMASWSIFCCCNRIPQVG
jgi:hypothetical protein